MGRSNRFLPYVAAAALVAAVLVAAGVPLATVLPFAVALACPLAMVLMMRNMAGMHGRPSEQTTEPPAGSVP